MPSRASLLMGLVWVAGAAVATTIGVVAVDQVASKVGDSVSEPLTASAIRDALAAVPVASAPATPPPASVVPSSPPVAAHRTGAVRTVTTEGGVVGARCTDDRPVVLYASPAEDYRTERLHAGRLTTSVRFTGEAQRFTLSLTCRESAVQFKTRTERLAQPSTSPPVRPSETKEPHESEPPEPLEPPEPPEPLETPEPIEAPEISRESDE